METLKNLNNYEEKIFSQNGEDGILKQIFKVIKTTNKYFVEFGTEYGGECNTRYLRENMGFNGLMMDGQYENKNINLHKEFITAENINKLFSKYNVPLEFDLLSIDIDFNDWYIWNALDNKYRPRVVVIEYNADHKPNIDKLVPYHSQEGWDGSNYFGASILAFEKLANKKKYTLLASDKKGVNLFFVKTDILPLNFKKSLDTIYFHSSYNDDGRGKGHKLDILKRQYIKAEYILNNEEQNIKNKIEIIKSGY